MNHKATALGIMSGSSLDGLDLCKVLFEFDGKDWGFEILEARKAIIPEDLISQMKNSPSLDQYDLARLDHDYGDFIAESIDDLATDVDIIGLHGHTVKHSPSQGVSLQIGSAQSVAKITGVPTVGNFRMKDILLGGQGAPLVPMGEKHLFPDFNSFLNLGGICNSSHSADEKWIAGDIGPFNQVFNFYANKFGRPFDDGGKLAASGQVLEHLVDRWSSHPFFEIPFPKSLGNAWVGQNFFHHEESPQDVLASFAEFISAKIADQLNQHSSSQTLVTGGGAYNDHVLELLREKSIGEIILPEPIIIDFKEALIFAFLGLLRSLNIPNVLSTCTGAIEDSCGGDLYTA